LSLWVKEKLIKGGSGNTNIYIYPGYEFKFIDGLITNFHTPKSTLLALVYAFGGQDLMKVAYQKAIDNKYRFFSYGDGMIII
jgi:S-adenosylmethionine:tRNA ribosyltransferase-isomerase